MAKVDSIKTQPACWFKYNPRTERLVIECQPIKPYTALDQIKMDTFQREKPVFKGGEDEPKPSI